MIGPMMRASISPEAQSSHIFKSLPHNHLPTQRTFESGSLALRCTPRLWACGATVSDHSSLGSPQNKYKSLSSWMSTLEIETFCRSIEKQLILMYGSPWTTWGMFRPWITSRLFRASRTRYATMSGLLDIKPVNHDDRSMVRMFLAHSVCTENRLL